MKLWDWCYRWIFQMIQQHWALKYPFFHLLLTFCNRWTDINNCSPQHDFSCSRLIFSHAWTLCHAFKKKNPKKTPKLSCHILSFLSFHFLYWEQQLKLTPWGLYLYKQKQLSVEGKDELNTNCSWKCLVFTFIFIIFLTVLLEDLPLCANSPLD